MLFFASNTNFPSSAREYKVLERELRASEDGNNLLVSVIEFESTALMLGQVGVRVSLISYPVVSVRKVSGSSCLLDYAFISCVDFLVHLSNTRLLSSSPQQKTFC